MSSQPPAKEKVWDYPRPPALEPTRKHLRVLLNGIVIADTHDAYRVLETSHPPAYYIPPKDTNMQLLKPSARHTFCEWKGTASYFDVDMDGTYVKERIWTYPDPTDRFKNIKDYLCFYASPFECYVDDEAVQPQPGDFYGGWITKDLEGPFKGAPGSMGW
eukprot:jgi/Chrzof1/5456/Cz16g04020.t1